MDTNDLNQKMGRRTFLKQAGFAGLAGVGFVLGLTACGGDSQEGAATGSSSSAAKPAAKSAADPCSDLAGLTPDEMATRTTFQYKKVTDDPAKVCTNCNFWIPQAEGKPCGGCTLVKGPIHPGGGCISWVAILKS